MRSRYTRGRAAEITHLQGQGFSLLSNDYAAVAYRPGLNLQGREYGEAKGWRGKADKPTFYYTFRTLAQMSAYIDAFLANSLKNAQAKEASNNERRAKRAALKASDHYTQGDILYRSWGYDQTNIDFYQVVEIKAKSIVVRHIAGNYNETGFMSGHTTAVKDHFTGEPKTLHLDERGNVKYSKWDGKPKYESHYA